MKILLVNTTDIGGAGNACIRLYEGLKFHGQEPSLVLKNKNRSFTKSKVEVLVPSHSLFEKNRLIFKKLLRYFKIYGRPSKKKQFLKSRSKKLEMFSYPSSCFDITQAKSYSDADIINLHWVANFLDYKSFFKKNSKPVIWTLHDMNPFTGGEHYEEELLGIDKNGKPIQRIKTNKEIAISNLNLKIKINLFKNIENMTIVSPSLWLLNEARKSDVFKGKEIVHIPNGINKDIFTLRDKSYSRDVFNIPKNKKVILFVAESINNSRKGFVFLERALEKLSSGNILLCTVGNCNINIGNSKNILELGPINDERLMALVYSAADLFVIPSLMDNLPNTVLESIMCGTPVVGFEVGGIPDIIEDGVNGYLADEISVNSLYAAIMKYLEFPDLFDREKIRDKALEKYDLNIQAKRYMELFKKITNQ